MSAPSSLELNIDALLSGQAALPNAWLEGLLPGDGARAEAALAALFWAKWQRLSGLHASFLDALEPLSRAMAALPAAQWIGSKTHPLWRLLELLQRRG
ncbi:MAG TPA: hypothetical protein VFM32_03750, partial [Spongiibacteraceae bacterium]|nr:hypothetical protein [Spongiibacteraceae bacterium]